CILEIMKKTAREGALRIVDPVMADNGKLYAGFDQDFPQEMKKLVNGADVIMPNLTEASFLLGIPYDPVLTKERTEKILKDLYKLGAKNVILTGVSFEESKLGVASYNGSTFDYYFAEKQKLFCHGTGDVYASAVAGALMRGKSVAQASAIAADFVVESIKKTEGDKDHWYGVKFEKALPYLIERLK
ncbi:MAG: bifunctional hydroxymethylpyrimidine kinase/phosphomethylpyrimidine kinase, partial [Treponemataceae bacterium]|nr:bifunctional hydroxymethylpyrimidine kinase/phosphomethylpyrimidine kinase [Treponemataceae bacterium]